MDPTLQYVEQSSRIRETDFGVPMFQALKQHFYMRFTPLKLALDPILSLLSISFCIVRE